MCHKSYPAVLCIVAALCFSTICCAHPKAEIHINEICSVFPFDFNNPKNKKIKDWIDLISSWKIDEYWGEPCAELGGSNFYGYIHKNFGFSLSSGAHRLFFHWPYNAEPWSNDLAIYIGKYSWHDNPDSVMIFKRHLKEEQARRNKEVNDRTSEVFGFAKGGKEGTWSNAFAAIVYDVHLLGDWTPQDNLSFTGLSPVREIIGDLIDNIHRIDGKSSWLLIRYLRILGNTPTMDSGKLAEDTIASLQKELPAFISNAQDGSIKRRLQGMGYVFKL